jgi:hypothetical protein
MMLQLDMKWLRPLLTLLPFVGLLQGESAPTPTSIVETYTSLSSAQNVRLRGASMEVEVEASLPKFKQHGRLRALRHISRLGRVTYDVLNFEGDNRIKNDVIARYLAADVDAEANDDLSLAVIPANYKFTYLGMAGDADHQVYVFQLKPKSKRLGLFKGELWLDANTCLPVREAGRLVKNPSIFVRRIEFVREYDIHDGIAFPRQLESTVDTRLVGKAELTVRFHDVSLAESSALSLAASAGQ